MPFDCFLIFFSDKLCQYQELSKTCSLLLIASQQCESGASTLSSEWGQCGDNFDYSSDQDQEMFGAVSLDVFQEDAVLMNSAVVLPLVSQYATNNPLLEWPEEGMHTCYISHCEIKSHRIWPIWKPIPIRFFRSHSIFRPCYNTFYEEININHILLCLSQASYI